MIDLLRHYLASLEYRCTKAISDVQPNYPYFELGFGVRKPIEILSHISFVLRCAHSVFNEYEDLNTELGSWEEEKERFYSILKELDKSISNELPPRERIIERLLQGPLSDAMTHVGQLSMIRRMAGCPIPAENFFNADIEIINIEID